MKEWTIDEFVAECDLLSRTPYSYDFERMPSGVCNGHTVEFCDHSLAAVIIDHVIINMGVINARYPNGSTCFQVGRGETMTGLEFVRYCLR